MSSPQDETENSASSHNERDEGRRTSRRGSDFFRRMRNSFYRSNGQSGATPQILRGHGADFEGQAKVFRGDDSGDLYAIICCCVPCKRSKEEYKYILIKGTSCFVFSNENASSPKYAIPLERLHTERIKGSCGDGKRQTSSSTIVKLMKSLGDVEYEFEFKTSDAASIFCRAVSKEAKVAADESAKKSLGHVMDKAGRTKSFVYASKIAEAKKKDQPDRPISGTDVCDAYVTMAAPGGIGAL